MDISNNIKSIREAKNIKQIDVAKALDLDPSYYHRLEKERGNKLTIGQLELIAGALGVSVVEILTGESKKGEENLESKEFEKRVYELEQSLKEVRELNVYQQKNIDSKNVALKLLVESFDLLYVMIQQGVLEEPQMPVELAKIAYSHLNGFEKLLKLIIDTGDLSTMEENLRKLTQDDSQDWIKFLSIFDKRNKQGGLGYWDGRYMVSEESKK